MRSLRSMCGVSRKDRFRNSDVGDGCSLKEDVVTRVERGIEQLILKIRTVYSILLRDTMYDRAVCKAMWAPGRVLSRERARAPRKLISVEACRRARTSGLTDDC
ncbi:hypothetical protein EVAR_51170_1 [Eumeta japonica]|uniref:Uncharacterized protein n=1 Tax=Eumeta variegata TaxID=151549 RepID=A0A4C1XC91_EUMVA|nr:hypothetical protein EVAR_51170_1 [Eumeta japonica]